MNLHFTLLFWLFKLSFELYEYLPDSLKFSDEIWDYNPSNTIVQKHHLIQAVRAHDSEYVDKRNGVVYKSGKDLIDGNCTELDSNSMEVPLIKDKSNTWGLFKKICYGPDKKAIIKFDYPIPYSSYYQYKFKLLFPYDDTATVKISLDGRGWHPDLELCTFQMNKGIINYKVIIGLYRYHLILDHDHDFWNRKVVRWYCDYYGDENDNEIVDVLRREDNDYDNSYFKDEKVTFKIEGDDRVALVSYLMFSRDSSIRTEHYHRDYDRGIFDYSGLNCNKETVYCAENHYCIDNHFYEFHNDHCAQCERNCKVCTSKNENACTRCFRNSEQFADKINGACVFDHIETSLFPKVDIRVPPAIHWATTVEFWVYFNNPELVDSVVVRYSDFLTIRISHTNTKKLHYSCVPLQWVYKYNKADKITYGDFIRDYGAFGLSVEYDHSGAPNAWNYIRCAFDLHSSKAYMNTETEYNFPIPQVYENGDRPLFHTFKFYKHNDTTLFKISGLIYEQYCYFKNIQVYRDYIPPRIVTKYYNFARFPEKDVPHQLLFSIPFDNGILGIQTHYSSIKILDWTITLHHENATFIYEWYDYSSNNNKTFKNPRRDEIDSFEDDTVYPDDYKNIHNWILAPPRNFKRLNLLLEKNTVYADMDLHTTKQIYCNVSNGRLCSESEKVIQCENNNYYNPFFKTDAEQCDIFCPDGYSRNPTDNETFQGEICNFKCPDKASICSYHTWEHLDISSFTCGSGQLTHYYQCTDESIGDEVAIHFGSGLGSHSVYIELEHPLSFFMIDVWIYHDTHFDYDPNPLLPDEVLFQTNSLKVTGTKFYSTINSFETSVKGLFNELTWNHLYIAVDKGEKAFATFNQNAYVGTSPHSATLGEIIFCGKKENNCAGWGNAYYKKLKIWNLEYMTPLSVAYSHVYEDLNVFSLFYYFPFSLQTLLDNDIKEVLGKYKTTVHIPIKYAYSNLTKMNPDNMKLFNYQAHFAYEDIHPGRIITSADYVDLGSYYHIESTSPCSGGCEKCFGLGLTSCYKCSETIGIRSNDCSKSHLSDFYFRTPAVGQPSEIALNIKKNYFSQYKAVTLFFFIKVLIISDSSTPLITLDKENGLTFKYINQVVNDDPSFSSSNYGSFELHYDDHLQYKYSPFRQLFGKWIPVSLASFREYNTSITHSMNQMTVLTKNLNYLDIASASRQANRTFLFKEFIIHNGWVGFVSDVNFYNGFIINAWGFRKTQYQTTLLLLTFSLTSKSREHCVKEDDFKVDASPLGLSTAPLCYVDFNPYMYEGCTNGKKDLKVNTEEDEPSCGSYDDEFNNEGNIACDYRDKAFYNYIISYSEDQNYLVCKEIDQVDLARFTYGNITNIENPQGAFSYDFWFFTQSYVHDTYENGTEYTNFVSFTLTWDFHIKVKIYSINHYFLKVVCIPIPDHSNPSLDTTPYSYTVENTAEWIYINCGVNYANKIMYLTQNTDYAEDIKYESSTIIPPPDMKVSLYYEEDSLNSYGLTFMNALRLWNCYDCSVKMRNIIFKKNDPKFISVLHALGGGLPDGSIVDENQDGLILGHLIEREGFIGYNVIQPIEKPKVCNEDNFYFYDYTADACIRLVDLSRTEESHVTFEVPSSRTGRYTIDLWFYVELPTGITTGLNFIYDKHVGLSIIRNEFSPTSINALCFPQEYMDDLNGKVSDQIFTLYNTALNKEQVVFTNGGDKWNFVRCAVDLTRDVFYMNSNSIKQIKPEVLYGDVSNVKAFRYFDYGKTSEFSIQNAKLSGTRIFARCVTLYREYIPNTFLDTRYMNLMTFSLEYYWPLVFHLDFEHGTISEENNKEVARYTCHYLDEYHPNTSGYQKDKNCLKVYDGQLLRENYTTYPMFKSLVLCKKNYEYINGTCKKYDVTDSDCRKSESFCFKKDKYFYKNGTYIDIETFNDYSESSCNPGFVVLPDSPNKGGLCTMSCDSSVYYYDECPAPSGFECIQGYDNSFYKCIEESQIEDSALYFNSFYSFSSLNNDLSGTTHDSYYFEFWYKQDKINNRIGYPSSNNRVHYLYAYPHQIYRDTSTDEVIYTFKNNESNPYTFHILSEYEWNKIIIHQYYDDSTKDVIISIYENYEFNPSYTNIVTANVSDRDDAYLKNIIFCNSWPNAQCTTDDIPNKNLYWNNAWYRNIRIWDDKETNLELIKLYGTFWSVNTTTIQPTLIYFPFDIESINMGERRIEEKIASKHFKPEFWFYSYYSDSNMLINYSTNAFDYSYNNPGMFISGLADTGKDYVVGSCSTGCSRCYSSAITDCYECKNGFILYGKRCKASTGYYFQSGVEDIKLNLSKVEPTSDLDIFKINPLTITFYLKFVAAKKSSSETKKVLDFGGFNIKYKATDTEQKLLFQTTESRPVIFTYDIKPFYAQWIHIGISIYNKNDSLSEVFPSMVNVMVDNTVLPLISSNPSPREMYNLGTIEINKFKFSKEVIALYSMFKFYNNYWLGTYGLVSASAAFSGIDLLYTLTLSGTTNNNCIATKLIDGLSTGLNCISDYNPYEDSLVNCLSDDKFIMNLNLESPCSKCDVSCLTQCYTQGQCSSKYNEGLYWIDSDRALQDFASQRIKNINFMFYDDIEIKGISTPTNKEMSLEFWANLYYYVKQAEFTLTLDWAKHIKVLFEKKDGEDKIHINCKPLTHKNPIASEITKGVWYYIRCSADLYLNQSIYKVYENGNREIESETINLELREPYVRERSSTFSITKTHSSGKSDYGFILLREIKILSKCLFSYWNPSHTRITPNNFPYILHYYTGVYEELELSKASLFDEILKSIIPLKLVPNIIGYNYIEGFKDLVICTEEETYEAATDSCEPKSNATCGVYSNNICLSCVALREILTQQGICSDSCVDYHYDQEYVQECRPCHTDCATCFGREYNNCLSCKNCTSPSSSCKPYFYELGNQCVEDCSVINTVPVDNEYKCVGFIAKSEVVEPVDYKTVLLDPAEFKTIIAEVFDTPSTGYSCEWTLDVEETNNVNGMEINGFIGGNPICANSRSHPVYSVDGSYFCKITFDNPESCFDVDKKYVFNLRIYEGTLETNHKYTFQTNDLPIISDIESIPTVGYLTSTKFVFRCGQCTDSNTPKEELKYEISYVKGTYDVSTSTPTPKNLTEFSTEREVLAYFPTPNFTQGDYTIICTCQDKMGAKHSITKQITLIDEVRGVIDKPLKDVLEDLVVTYSLSKEETLKRIKTFVSLTTNRHRDSTLIDRTVFYSDNTGNNRGSNGEMYLYKTDPDNNRKYCTNKGKPYLISNYIYCKCDSTYIGMHCHIDESSTTFLTDTIKKLFNRLQLFQQTSTFDEDALTGIYDLLNTAIYILDDEEATTFFNDVSNFITSSMLLLSPNDFCSRNEYLEMFDLMYEWMINKMNQMKYTNYVQHNKQASYSYDEMRNAELTKEQETQIGEVFISLKTKIEELVKYYKDNSVTLNSNFKWRLRNFNVYIQNINELFNFNDFFIDEINNYESYFNCIECLSETMFQIFKQTTYEAIFVFINWKVNPYSYSPIYMHNITSPLSSIEIYDKATLKQITIKTCPQGKHIKMYFPISNYTMPSKINDIREVMPPSMQSDFVSYLVMDPIYIDTNGKVYPDISYESMTSESHSFNLSCQYYNTKTNNYSINGIEYSDYTHDNYIECSSSHFSEFAVFTVRTSSKITVASRFFYLKHYKVMFNRNNYTNSNTALFLYVVLVVCYVVGVLYYVFTHMKKQVNSDLIESLNEALINDVFVYDKNVQYKNKLRLPEHVKMQLDLNEKVIAHEHKNVINSEVQKFLTSNKTLVNKTKGNNNSNTSATNVFFVSGGGELTTRKENTLTPDEMGNEHISSTRCLNRLLNEKKRLLPIHNFNETVFHKEQSDNNNNEHESKSAPPKKNKEDPHDFFAEVDNNNNNNDDNIIIKEDNPQLQYLDGIKRPKETVNKPQSKVLRIKHLPKQNINTLEPETPENPLPKITAHLTADKRRLEFYHLKLTMKELFLINIKTRHYYYTSLFTSSMFHKKFIQVSNVLTFIALNSIFLSIFLTTYKQANISDVPNGGGYVILSSLFSLLISCIVMYGVNYIQYITIDTKREMYCYVQSGKELMLLREFNKMKDVHKWNEFAYVVVQIVIWCVGFYFSFGFCATYVKQANSFIVGMAFIVGFDCFVFEFVCEGIIVVLYRFRKLKRGVLIVGEFMNLWRNVKVLK